MATATSQKKAIIPINAKKRKRKIMNFEKDPMLSRKDLELEEAWAFQFQDNDNIEELEEAWTSKLRK